MALAAISFVGMCLVAGGLLVALKNRSLSGPSIYPEVREARRRGQLIIAVGFLLCIIGMIGRFVQQ